MPKAKWANRNLTTVERIRFQWVPAWLENFRRKASDYNSTDLEPHTILGERGQFADIWRKVWKLKKALWDGEKLTGEQPEEILEDLISHCFLTLDLLRNKPVWSGPSESSVEMKLSPENMSHLIPTVARSGEENKSIHAPFGFEWDSANPRLLWVLSSDGHRTKAVLVPHGSRWVSIPGDDGWWYRRDDVKDNQIGPNQVGRDERK